MRKLLISTLARCRFYALAAALRLCSKPTHADASTFGQCLAVWACLITGGLFDGDSKALNRRWAGLAC
jgi:hypothetical protein